MNYTKSNSYTEHAGTGQRMHDAAKAIPTQVSDSDLNMVIWSLMEIIKEAGLQGVDFNADNPESYKQLLKALQKQRVHTHPDATPSAPGFMSAADKQKLDGLGTGAFVRKTGDTMTGPLVLHPLSASDDSNHAASTSFVRRLFQSFAPLFQPVFVKQDSNLEGGEIRLQAADNQPFGDLSIDYNNTHVRFFATHKHGGQTVVAQLDLSRIGGGATQDLLMPPGSLLLTASSHAPTGYLPANGAAVGRTAYPHLFAAIGTTYGAGDGSSTFNLPDLRGEFIRGWDNGRGVDPGRALGSAQGDAIRNITGYIHSLNGAFTVENATGAFAALNQGQRASNDPGYVGYAGLSLDVSRVVPTANENRPRNVALLPCIKY